MPMIKVRVPAVSRMIHHKLYALQEIADTLNCYPVVGSRRNGMAIAACRCADLGRSSAQLFSWLASLDGFDIADDSRFAARVIARILQRLPNDKVAAHLSVTLCVRTEPPLAAMTDFWTINASVGIADRQPVADLGEGVNRRINSREWRNYTDRTEAMLWKWARDAHLWVDTLNDLNASEGQEVFDDAERAAFIGSLWPL